jgi:hypothetical protein
MKLAAKIALYGAAALIVAFLAYGAWFIYVWGFNPLGLMPFYLIGLLAVLGLAVGARRIGKEPHA